VIGGLLDALPAIFVVPLNDLSRVTRHGARIWTGWETMGVWSASGQGGSGKTCGCVKEVPARDFSWQLNPQAVEYSLHWNRHSLCGYLWGVYKAAWIVVTLSCRDDVRDEL